MKKIFRYVILLLVMIVVVRVYVYFLTKTYYHEMNNYKVLVENPKIEVTESKVAKNKGYIKGKAVNEEDKLITNLKIRFDFYNDLGKYAGSEYKEIDYFNVGEVVKFDIKYEYQNIEEIRISIINEE